MIAFGISIGYGFGMGVLSLWTTITEIARLY